MKSTHDTTRQRAWVGGTLVLILLLAAALRLYRFGALPPGLNYDEAAHAIAARQLLETRHFVPFFPINFGLEAGYIYLIAGLFALSGPFAEGGRIISLFAGLLNIPLTFVLARELFASLLRPRPLAGRWATVGGVFAAAQAAFIYWSIHHSRMGFELMLTATMSSLAFWALWRAARDGRLWRYGLAGGLLGLSLYTYPAARLLPLTPAALAILLLMQRRTEALRSWPVAVVYVGSAVLAASPLLIFVARHPDMFLARAGQVAVLSPAVLAEGVWRSLGGVVWRGDLNPRLNLPGRPLLDPLQALLFGLGLVSLLRAWRRPAGAFMGLWLGTMFLPGMLSDYPPHFARLCGLLPPLTLITAWGGIEMCMRIAPQRQRLAWGGLCLAALLSAAWSAYGYFGLWPRTPDLLTTFDAGFRRAGEIIRDLPPDGPTYLSPLDRDYLTLRFVAGDARAGAIKSYNGRRCVVLPDRPTRPAYHVVIVAEDSHSLPFLESAWPGGRVIQREKLGGTPYLAVFQTPAGAAAQVSMPHDLVAIFHELGEGEADRAGGLIVLRGFGLEERAYRPGETLTLKLAWQATGSTARAYTSFVHLLGPHNPASGNPLWGQEDAQPCDNAYPTNWWSPGEWVIEMRYLTIAPDAPPGDYQLSVGWYDLASGQRLPTASGDDHLSLTTIHVTQ